MVDGGDGPVPVCSVHADDLENARISGKDIMKLEPTTKNTPQPGDEPIVVCASLGCTREATTHAIFSGLNTMLCEDCDRGARDKSLMMADAIAYGAAMVKEATTSPWAGLGSWQVATCEVDGCNELVTFRVHTEDAPTFMCHHHGCAARGIGETVTPVHREHPTELSDLESKQQALIEGGCRGGFGTEELDGFIPGWRNELSERTAMQLEIAQLTEELASLRRKVGITSYPRDDRGDDTAADQ